MLFNDQIAITSTISMLPEVIKGSEASICYDGILSDSGAERVYLHYGFDGWNNTKTVPMKKSHSGGFNAEISLKGKNELNFCFKDSANNWDNNHGSDWKIGIM